MTESAAIRLAGRKSGQCDITITHSFYYEVIQGELLQLGVAISVDTAYSTSVLGRAFLFADNFGFYTEYSNAAQQIPGQRERTTLQMSLISVMMPQLITLCH